LPTHGAFALTTDRLDDSLKTLCYNLKDVIQGSIMAPYRSSLLLLSVPTRLLLACIPLVALWLAVSWAVALP
jgi:hypothetical protein